MRRSRKRENREEKHENRDRRFAAAVITVPALSSAKDIERSVTPDISTSAQVQTPSDENAQPGEATPSNKDAAPASKDAAPAPSSKSDPAHKTASAPESDTAKPGATEQPA